MVNRSGTATRYCSMIRLKDKESMRKCIAKLGKQHAIALTEHVEIHRKYTKQYAYGTWNDVRKKCRTHEKTHCCIGLILMCLDEFWE